MTTTDPAGPGRTRLVGLGLLALAAVALVIGLISLFGGGDGEPPSANPQPTGTGAGTEQPTGPVPSPLTPSPTGDPGVPSTPSVLPTTQPSLTATSVQPSPPPVTGTATPQPPAPGTQQQVGSEPDRSQPVRVYNNSTIKGLADRAGDDFQGAGWNVVERGNYSGGVIYTSTVYFRPGTAEEAVARQLGNQFGLRVEPRFDGIQDAAPGVIVIVTKEYGTPKGK